MLKASADWSSVPRKIGVLRKLGVPYAPMGEAEIERLLQRQANEIAASLAAENLSADPRSQIIALIAYLQVLGTSIRSTARWPNVSAS